MTVYASRNLPLVEQIAYVLQAYDDLSGVAGAEPVLMYLRGEFRRWKFKRFQNEYMRAPFPSPPPPLVVQVGGVNVLAGGKKAPAFVDPDAVEALNTEFLPVARQWEKPLHAGIVGNPAQALAAVAAHALKLVQRLGPAIMKSAPIAARRLSARAMLLLSGAATKTRYVVSRAIKTLTPMAATGALVAATATGAAAGAAGAKTGDSYGWIFVVGATLGAGFWIWSRMRGNRNG